MDCGLEDKILAENECWEVEDQPLAATEGMQEHVEGILNFSEFTYRTYRRGDTEISVYVAYWEPRKMPVRQVQSHTPDICWVRNGWNMLDKEYSVEYEVDGQPLFPAEIRSLDNSTGHTEYVAYWHVLGDQIYVNRTKPGQWDRWDPFKTLMKFGLHQQKEQFFVRINSNRPINEIWGLPIMQEIMRDLAELTLIPPADQAAQS
ncbi:MAG: exosortase-associated EpsI family protein [Puniceicoccales bacterium]